MMRRRGLVLLVAGLAAPACTPPLPPPAAGTLPRMASAARLPLTLDRPLGGAALPRGADPAPMPNREIQAPPDLHSDPLAPRLEPMVLRQDRPQGVTFGSEHIREVAPDRSMEAVVPGMRIDDVLPGARLRIPFE